MKTFEIMFYDLNEEAQSEFLKFQEVESVSDLNVDDIPIATIDLEEENG